MITVGVKTLTGIDHRFEVAPEGTVGQFKETISATVQIPPERQRLIFQGRVLQDNQILGDIGLDQRTVHLVERLPGVPASSSASSSPLPRRRGVGGNENATAGIGEISQQQVVVGAVALPSGDLTRDQIAGSLRRILDRVGDVGRMAEVEARETQGGVQVDIRLRTNPPREPPQQNDGSEQIDGPATQRVEHIRHVLSHISGILNHLETDNGTTTERQPSDSSGQTATSEERRHSCCAPEAPNSIPSNDTAQANVAEGQTGSVANDYHTENDVINGEDVQVRQIRISGLASLLDDILRIEERLRPHLARYQAILRQDANYSGESEEEGRRASRLFNSIQTILHNLAHVYHAYSDLNVHFCRPPPRDLYPQLVGQRLPPAGQGSMQRATATIQTSAEVQITMNFQRNGDGQEGQEAPRPASVPAPPVFAVPSPPFPTIRVNNNVGNGAAFTTLDITPNSVTVNQVTARIVTGNDQPRTGAASAGSTATAAATASPPTVSTPPSMPATTAPPASASTHLRQPSQRPGMPGNYLHQIMQGIAGRAATGIMSGSLSLGAGFGAPRQGAPQRQNAGQQLPRVGGGIRLRMQAPQPGQMGGFMAGQLPHRPAGMQGPNLIFTAAPYNMNQPNTQSAIFVGNEPPAVLPLYTFDEFLPCASRHFDPRNRPSLSTNRSSNRTQDTVASTTADTSTGESPMDTTGNESPALSEMEMDFERHLEPVVRSVVNSLRDSITRQMGPDGNGQEGLWQFVPIFTGGAAGPMMGAVGGQMNRLIPTAGDSVMRRPSSDPNLFRRGQQQRVAQQPPSNDRELIEGMVRGVYSNMMGHSTETLGDYLRSMGQESEHSDNVLLEMIQTVMLALSFTDIWALFANDARPLDRTRSVLRRHLVESLLNGNESPSEEDLRSAARRAASLDADVWQEVTADTVTADDLDFAATMVKCEETFLLDVMMMVFGYSFTPGEDFGRRLYDRAWLFAREAVTLAFVCCANGEQGYEQFANRVVTNTMRQVTEEFRQPFAAAGVQHLRTLYTQHRLDRAAVEQYLVKKETSATAMDQDASATGRGNAVSLSASAVDEDQSQAASSRSTTTSREEGEEWKRQLPQEWVQVMEVDVERQKDMPAQKPFSDAYLNGMPSKRRKVVCDQRPRAILDAAATSTEAFLKEVLRESIAEVGISPVTGEQVEDILDHISVDENGPELTNAFSENVEQRLGNRLRSEQMEKDNNGQAQMKDFDPARYPNAANRFLNQ